MKEVGDERRKKGRKERGREEGMEGRREKKGREGRRQISSWIQLR